MVNQNAKDRVGRLAGRQRGRVSWAQLRKLGVARKVINDWVSQGYLHRVLPGVYAVGHNAPSVEGDLAAAILYAGPNAVLSHGTAAWWWGLIDKQPSTIHVSSPRRSLSRRGIWVHRRRDCERAWRNRLPVTTIAQTLLDYAAKASLNKVRVALANAEYHRLLDVEAVQAMLGPGRHGGAKLRKALARHQPRLARTRSPVEVAFFELCERFGIALPEVNARIHGWTVDFFWREAGVVVEVDPHGNHHTHAQVDRDRRKDLELRTAGLVVHRYSREQVEQTPAAIGADVLAALAARRPASTSRSPAGS